MSYALLLLPPKSPYKRGRHNDDAYQQAIYRSGESKPVFRFATDDPWAEQMLETLNEHN